VRVSPPGARTHHRLLTCENVAGPGGRRAQPHTPPLPTPETRRDLNAAVPARLIQRSILTRKISDRDLVPSAVPESKAHTGKPRQVAIILPDADRRVGFALVASRQASASIGAPGQAHPWRRLISWRAH